MFVVKDDSMMGDRLLTGDVLLIDPEIENKNDNNGVLLIEVDGDKIIRRVYFSEGKYMLYASNPSYPDVTLTSIKVIGRIHYNVVRF
ncbi:SOS-response transcriptional repressor LexA [Paenibacillus sp. 4624]|uniref:S24 family peptidase n=1 Tax=Paenibacillus sp. 4624 TaxID=3156453 RepID=UPI003D1B0754